MSWWNFGRKHDAIESVSRLFATLITQIGEVRSELIRANERFDAMTKDEHRRFDQLLQQFINLAAQKNAPLSPGIPLDPLASLGLFEEVPVGDKSGYGSAELSLGAEYAESGTATISR